MAIHRILIHRHFLVIALFGMIASAGAGCQQDPGPTALEQVAVERVWDVPAFTVERQPGYRQFEGVTWKGSREGSEPEVGVTFALTWKDGFKGSAAHSKRKSIPDDIDYVGAPRPASSYRVEEGRIVAVTDPSAWDWSTGTFMRVFSQNGDLDHVRSMRELHDLKQRPDWWPTEGAASEASPEGGQFVPTRNAILYFFDSGSGLVKVKADGRRYYDHGPFECIVEDHTGDQPRRVGFRLSGEPGWPPGSIFMAHDGSWAIAFEEESMRAWFLPLHLAWDYLDGAQDDAVSGSLDADDEPQNSDP